MLLAVLEVPIGLSNPRGEHQRYLCGLPKGLPQNISQGGRGPSKGPGDSLADDENRLDRVLCSPRRGRGPLGGVLPRGDHVPDDQKRFVPTTDSSDSDGNQRVREDFLSRHKAPQSRTTRKTQRRVCGGREHRSGRTGSRSTKALGIVVTNHALAFPCFCFRRRPSGISNRQRRIVTKQERETTESDELCSTKMLNFCTTDIFRSF